MIDGEPETFEEAVKLLNEAKLKIARLEDLLKLRTDKIFGRSSEKFFAQGEFDFGGEFFNQVSFTSEPEYETKTVKQRKHPKKTRGWLSMDDSIPLVEVHDTLKPEERICRECGATMVKIGEEVSYRIEVKPREVKRVRVIRDVYECKKCEGIGAESDRTVTVTANHIKFIIEKSFTTASLLATVFSDRFVAGIPYNRQEQIYKYQGLKISRTDMCNWQEKIHEILKPLEDLLVKESKKGRLLGLDETTVEILRQSREEIIEEKGCTEEEYLAEKARKKRTIKGKGIYKSEREKCYMWIVLGGTDKHPVHLFNFRWTRSGENVLPFLEGFEGNAIQSDGFSGYDSAINTFNASHPDHQIPCAAAGHTAAVSTILRTMPLKQKEANMR